MTDDTPMVPRSTYARVLEALEDAQIALDWYRRETERLKEEIEQRKQGSDALGMLLIRAIEEKARLEAELAKKDVT